MFAHGSGRAGWTGPRGRCSTLFGVERIADWWDGFELWVAGLPFIPQFLVVLVGMVPISFGIAYLIDRAVRLAAGVLGHDDMDGDHETRSEVG